MGRYLIPLGVFLVLGLALAAGLMLDPRRVPSPLIDSAMPRFTLPQLREPLQTLDSDALRGQVVVLNVWASWCVACREEHPLLLALARAGEIKLYGINYKDQREDALRWLGYYGDPYLASGADSDGKIGIDFGVYGIPETFVVDKKGTIRHKHIGPITDSDWRYTIRPLLQQLNREAPT